MPILEDREPKASVEIQVSQVNKGIFRLIKPTSYLNLIVNELLHHKVLLFTAL